MISPLAVIPLLALISPIFAQNSTASSPASGTISGQTVQSIFLQSPENNDQWVGSVVQKAGGLTTYAIACTSGTYSCSTGATISVTEGSNTFGISTSINTAGGVGTVQESCTVAGTTSATCIAQISVSAQGTSTAYTTTTTVGTDEFHYAQVTITAGASKLTGADAATSTSSSKGGAARMTGVAGAAVVAGLGVRAIL